MSIRSESPYQRHGAADATVEQRKRLYRITGTEQVFWVAHATLGEWREWRRVTEENEIFDPLNLRGFVDFSDDVEIIVPIEVDAEDGTTEDVNFTTDLGRDYDLAYQTPELQGEGRLFVTDLEGGSYVVGEDFGLAFRAPGEAAAGTVTDLKISDMKAPDGSASPTSVHMISDSGAFAITITLDLDTWLVFWLHREIPITFVPFAATNRDFLVVPTIELPQGRGDA